MSQNAFFYYRYFLYFRLSPSLLAYISLHAYGQAWLTPWGYTTQRWALPVGLNQAPQWQLVYHFRNFFVGSASQKDPEISNSWMLILFCFRKICKITLFTEIYD
jgi:hypothetical protein